LGSEHQNSVRNFKGCESPGRTYREKGYNKSHHHFTEPAGTGRTEKKDMEGGAVGPKGERATIQTPEGREGLKQAGEAEVLFTMAPWPLLNQEREKTSERGRIGRGYAGPSMTPGISPIK